MLTLTREAAGEGAGILKIAGEATIEHTAELRQALLDGLAQCQRLQLDCAAVSGIDFFVTQLLCSAHRTSIAWNKELSFHGGKPVAVEEGIRKVGFARHRGCSHCPPGVRCLWL